MNLLDKIRNILGPKVKTCQYCGETKPKMIWGFHGWFCCTAHIDAYWVGGSTRFKR